MSDRGCDSPLDVGSNEQLKDAIQQALDEARMILPGLQALFGFQLIAVFNNRFDIDLSAREQHFHLAALLLVTTSIALAMTPAAYHRQTQPGKVSAELLTVISRLINLSLLPLAGGLCLEIYLMARLITHEPVISATVAIGQLLLLAVLWRIFPRSRKQN